MAGVSGNSAVFAVNAERQRIVLREIGRPGIAVSAADDAAADDDDAAAAAADDDAAADIYFFRFGCPLSADPSDLEFPWLVSSRSGF